MNIAPRAKRLLVPCPRKGKPKVIVLIGLFVICVAILILLADRHALSLIVNDALPTQESVSLVVVSDSSFSDKYNTQAKSIECYAQQHGYSFFKLDPEFHAPVCKSYLNSFFFQKHCTVSTWLRTQPRDLVAVVLDGDVIGGTSNKSLAIWLNYSFDIAFYERSWNFEIASGNYIVRNTPFAQNFLMHWANYESKEPKGFSSADNGAIHLAVLDALAVRGRQRCYDLYRALNETSTPTNLKAYFQFVGCTRRLLGPPRTHVAIAFVAENSAMLKHEEKEDKRWRQVGVITIFPRFFGFAVDSVVHGFTEYRNLHPFHHGVKSETWWKDYVDYNNSDDFAFCKTFSQNGTISDEAMGKILRSADLDAIRNRNSDYESIPRWEQTDKSCYDRMWCEALPAGTGAWPPGLVFSNGKPKTFLYEYPGVEWYNEFASGIESKLEF